MYAFWFLLWIVVVSLSPVVLPITVLMEGTPLEWILVFVVFIPLAGLVIAASKDDDSGYFIFWGMLVALGVTTLFFWFVQLAMLGALFAFGKIVNTAATWTASSIFASGAYWCVAKSAEHSLTERVLHFGRTALAACVRGLLSRFG